MELVYRNRLVHFIGKSEQESDGENFYEFFFRDIAGEKIKVRLGQETVPNTFFGCSDVALAKGLQEILDLHAEAETMKM